MRAGPYTIVIDGRDIRLEDRGAVYRYIRELDALGHESDMSLLMNRFRLGSALIQAKKQLGYGNILQLYREIKVHRNTAQHACRLAQRCSDPATGAFDPERHRQWTAEIAEQKRTKSLQRRVSEASSTQAGGKAQVLCISEPASGSASPAPGGGGKAQDVCFSEPRPFDAGGSSVLAALASLETSPRPASRSTAPSPRVGAVGAVGATQIELPFHLAETARKLAPLAERVELAVASGLVSAGQAERLQALAEALHAELAAAAGDGVGDTASLSLSPSPVPVGPPRPTGHSRRTTPSGHVARTPDGAA